MMILLAEGSVAEGDVRLLIAIVGALVTVAGFLRIPLLLEQEFSDDEELVKKPMSFAVGAADSFAKFREDEWRGYRAACTAFRLQEFLDRFKLILDPKLGTGVFLVLFGVSIISYVVIYVQQTGVMAQGIVVGSFGLLTAIWIVVIEWGKALKRATTRLRLS
ncbi:MAG: hypothetical protein HY721_34035 [Planctomycetes bacterium]|nr:hypothetical protein [Planctomycetota bacterium]